MKTVIAASLAALIGAGSMIALPAAAPATAAVIAVHVGDGWMWHGRRWHHRHWDCRAWRHRRVCHWRYW